VHRTIAGKRRIVELTLAPGMSAARVAQAEGVNSHQVVLAAACFSRRRLDEEDEGATARRFDR
jgi:transposase-like protein